MKKTTPAQELFFAILLLAVFTMFLVLSLQYGERARMVPLAVSVASILFILIDLFFERVLGRRVQVDAQELFSKTQVQGACASVEDEGVCESDIAAHEEGHPEWQALLLVGGLLGLVWVFGIIAGLVIFLFGFFKMINRDSLLKSTVWAVGLTGSVWVVFGLALKVVFYQGIIGSLL
jgi:hypothetical protein